jgi:hypothetical protein
MRTKTKVCTTIAQDRKNYYYSPILDNDNFYHSHYNNNNNNHQQHYDSESIPDPYPPTPLQDQEIKYCKYKNSKRASLQKYHYC